VKRQEVEPAQPAYPGRSGPDPAKKTPPAQGASATDLDIYQSLSLPLHGSKSKSSTKDTNEHELRITQFFLHSC
jgi:hypothetical protein